MVLDTNLVIAVALVALVIVFIRISWTLKEIHEALLLNAGGNPIRGTSPTGTSSRSTSASNSAAVNADDESEIAAIIAIASAARRGAL